MIMKRERVAVVVGVVDALLLLLAELPTAGVSPPGGESRGGWTVPLGTLATGVAVAVDISGGIVVMCGWR